MTSSQPTRILVVANRTASTPKLVEEITRRDLTGPCGLFLLIPALHQHKYPDWTPESALSLVERAAPRARVELLAAEPDAITTIERTIKDRKVDEIIISTAPTHLAEWLGQGLPHRVKRLGVPVTVIPLEIDRSDAERFRELLEKSGAAAGGGPGYGGSGFTGF
jgi:hypothetical protein